MNRVQVYVFSFLCYTSIHALRTTYSYAKSDIAADIHIDSKWMGIVDALMLTFLGVGHFLHALQPIKRPVKSLWIAMLICGINYGLIPLCMGFGPLGNIYVLSIFMCINGFLQSYTWPNLLMIVNSKFDPAKYAVLLGFWATNANVGNIIGYGTFNILDKIKTDKEDEWKIGLGIAAIYALINGTIIALRFNELPIAGAKQVRQKSFMQYDLKSRLSRKTLGQKTISSIQDLQQSLIENQSKSVKSAKSLSNKFSSPASVSGLSRRSMKTIKQIENRISRGYIKSIKIVDQPQKVAQTPLSVIQVFKDPNIVLLTITFSLSKSVIYGIMLWLPLFFKSREDLKSHSSQIPITYDIAAIFGSVVIGYLFKKINNKGLLMIPFMVVLFICFFILKFVDTVLAGYFVIIAIVGFALGGIFNTLSGLVVMELTKVIPQNLKTSSLGFYSALTMAVGNVTTALTQILLGFVLGKQNQGGIFFVFMIYAAICLVCLIFTAIITWRQQGALSIGEVLVIQEIKGDGDQDEDSGGQQENGIKYAKITLENGAAPQINNSQRQSKKTDEKPASK